MKMDDAAWYEKLNDKNYNSSKIMFIYRRWKLHVKKSKYLPLWKRQSTFHNYWHLPSCFLSQHCFCDNFISCYYGHPA